MSVPDPADVGVAAARPPKPGVWSRLRTHLPVNALVLLGLSGLAVAQPLLDLYGRNPEVFVANDLTSSEIIAFALVVVLAIPLVCLLLEVVAYLVGERVGSAVHGVLVGALAALVVLGWVGDVGVEGPVVAFGVALAAGAGIAVAERRVRSVRTGLRFLVIAPLLVLVLFFFGSDTTRLLSESAAAVEVEVGFPSEERPPVVWVILDEFPLSTLIDGEGAINEERYPAFDRLAESSHWFRNSYSPAFLTQHAVPAMLTGEQPTGETLPTYADNPRNLFTLLGPEYDVWQYQVLTDLCPDEVCGEADIEVPKAGGLSQAFGDALVVYGHQTLPASMAEDLPAIDESWGGFEDDVTAVDDPSAPTSASSSTSVFGATTTTTTTSLPPGPWHTESTGPTTTAPPVDGTTEHPTSGFEDGRWRDIGDGGSAANQAAIFERMIDALDADAQGRLWFAHVALPHAPWDITPLGYQNTVATPKLHPESWDPARLAFEGRGKRQLHLLQAGVADQLLDRMMTRMQELGIWDESLVVVTSDHGNSMLPPDFGRTPTANNVDEVFRQPMFVKLPGQAAGEIHDEVASTVDLIPSIVDALGLQVEWEFDGHSLFDGSASPDTMEPMTGNPDVRFANPSFQHYLDSVVAVHERDFPRDDWLGVAAVGAYGPLVGEDASTLTISDGPGWASSINQADQLAYRDLSAGLLPLRVTGTLTLPDGVPFPPEEVVLVLNGKVAGVGGGWHAEDGAWKFGGFLAQELFVDGPNQLDVLVPTGTPQAPTFVRAPRL